MQVTIDPDSGFCFGVVHAIQVAERELAESGTLYCLGDIVHNSMEVSRLKELGLVVIDHSELADLHNCTVMIRAHGEPPETYQTALKNNIRLIDASCPIVLSLQQEVRHGYEEMQAKNGQIVIYGKEGHAEVNGLIGQTNGQAVVVGDESDLDRIDFSRPVRLYAQTTKRVEGFRKLVRIIESRMLEAAGIVPADPDTDSSASIDFQWNDSICRQVSNRSKLLPGFAAKFDVIIFVSGFKSSNGMVLYQVCKQANERTYLVSEMGELQRDWFEGAGSAGVCGATSTPRWLMESVAHEVTRLTQTNAPA